MMLGHMLAAAGPEVQEVLSLMREDYVGAAGFLADEGFCERFRSWGAHLDPRKFDPAPFKQLERQLAEDGIHIRCYFELVDDADRAGKLGALQLEVEADVQAFEPITSRHASDYVGLAGLERIWGRT